MNDYKNISFSQVDTFRRCIKREVNKRLWFYPKLVSLGKMTQQKADFELKDMQEVLDYFDWLQIHTKPEQQKLL